MLVANADVLEFLDLDLMFGSLDHWEAPKQQVQPHPRRPQNYLSHVFVISIWRFFVVFCFVFMKAG